MKEGMDTLIRFQLVQSSMLTKGTFQLGQVQRRAMKIARGAECPAGLTQHNEGLGDTRTLSKHIKGEIANKGKKLLQLKDNAGTGTSTCKNWQ